MSSTERESLLPGVLAVTPEDGRALVRAVRSLENPGLAARLSSKLGSSIEKSFKLLPDRAYAALHRAVRRSLEASLGVAIHSLGSGRPATRRKRHHKILSAVSGAAGGLFGLPAVLAELPLTSTILLRSVADIARYEGEDLATLDARLACLEVFALGGRASSESAADTGYYGVRLGLAMHFSTISEEVATRGIVRWSPPALVRFIAEVASRFGVVVTQKAAVQMVPVLGAATGSIVNLIFLEHFQDVAEAHFTIRRLERRYGAKAVRAEYERLQKYAMVPASEL